MRLVIMGPPGSGKGTQGAIVAARFGIPAISTGDIFRANVAQRTALGREAQRCMEAGEYVPDDVTNRMVRDRLALEDAAAGFLLDGYPRTPAQVEVLDAVVEQSGSALDGVVLLRVDPAELTARLLRRAQVEGRVDDTEDVIRRRQDLYAEQTAPLVAMYRKRSVLLEVDGAGDVDDVTMRLVTACRVALLG